MRARESFFSQPMTRYRRTQRFGDYLMLICVWLGACWLGWVVITAILAKRVMEGEAADRSVRVPFLVEKGGRP
jgi:hypothetical protein